VDIEKQMQRAQTLRNQVRLEAQQRRQADIDLVLNRLEVFEWPEPQRELTPWQREVAEARLGVLNEVAALQEDTEVFFAAAVRFERLSRSGKLSAATTLRIGLANLVRDKEKALTVAADTLCRWRSADDGTLASLAPAVAWNNAVPEWVKPMFLLLKTMEKPTLKGAVRELQRQGMSAEINRAKQYIKQLADRIRSEG